MRNFFCMLVLALSVGACGNNPCMGAVEDIGGLCMMDKWNMQGVSQTITDTENALHQAGANDLDLRELLSEYPYSVRLVEADDPNLEMPDGSVKAGLTELSYRHIYVKNRHVANACAEYRTLSHEILHVVAKYYLDADYDTNSTHMVPWMFHEYCRGRYRTECVDNMTVERESEILIESWCHEE